MLDRAGNTLHVGDRVLFVGHSGAPFQYPAGKFGYVMRLDLSANAAAIRTEKAFFSRNSSLEHSWTDDWWTGSKAILITPQTLLVREFGITS